MLKLERASRDGMISVIVRDKEYLFTRPFAVAFAIAIAIHLVLIILFHVAPFKIGMSDTVFPPTQLKADVPMKESVIANLEPTVPSLRGLPVYPPSGPILPTQPNYLSVRPIEYSKAENASALAFAVMEQTIYHPEFYPLGRLIKKPLEIVISGVLAQKNLISTGLNQKTVPGSALKESGRVIYAVMVEGKTGKIFWYESKQLINDRSIDKFAEAVLHDMKFAADPTMIAVSGEIELHFNFEAQ